MKDRVELLKAMSDDTRFKILELLLKGKKCVRGIFPPVKRTRSKVPIHLGNLKESGILGSRR